jgi:uncharacterized protein
MTGRMAKKMSSAKRKPLVITGSMFFKYSSCPHWVYFDRFGDPKKKMKTTRFTEMLIELGLLHEEEMIRDREYVAVRGRGNAARFKRTLKLMEQGVDSIYHGLLMAGDMVGEPDLLEKRTDRSSHFGAYHYVAIDIKSAERLMDAHRYQLSFYGDLLEQVQGVRPLEGYILNGSGARLGFVLSDFEQKYRLGLQEIRDMFSGCRPPPHLSSGCKASPWFHECIALAEAKDDVALLYNVKEKTLSVLRERGICTVAQAAVMDPSELTAAAPQLSRKTLDRLVLQAQALKETRHFIRRSIVLPSAPVEYHFDIEGDPLRQVEYLFGFLLREGGNERYEYILAEQPEDESELWARFLVWLERLPERFVVYHYGTYEQSRLTMLESRYGSAPALERFRAAMVDLNEIVKEAVVFPLYFYGIKDIGRYLGFERSGKIAGGGESVAYYEEWLEKKDRRKLDAIIKYNHEDVIATRYLKDWLEREQRDHAAHQGRA